MPWDWKTVLLASAGVLFIGIAKAGFGGALGLLATPICVVAFSIEGKAPSFGLGVLLPLLCSGDLFSMYHYWGKWDKRSFRCLIPGAVVGVAVGSILVGKFTPRELNICIGVISVIFVLYQVFKDRWNSAESSRLQPTQKNGLPVGVAAGITSTFAHGAGPVVSIFLLAQRLPKEIFVGTSVLVFTWINWIKLPFFVANQIITWETVLAGLYFLPLIPVGVWLGIQCNRRMSEALFLRVAYALVFLAGLYLLFDFHPATWARR